MTRAATRTLYGEPLPDGSKPFMRFIGKQAVG